MNRDGEPHLRSILTIYVMTSVDSSNRPAVLLQQSGKLFALKRPHITSSITFCSLPQDSGTVTERQPSMASRILAIKVSMVSPCVAQPGMAGTSAQYPPSSALWTITLIFIKLPFGWKRRELDFANSFGFLYSWFHRTLMLCAFKCSNLEHLEHDHISC